jgi:hypothetical protein
MTTSDAGTHDAANDGSTSTIAALAQDGLHLVQQELRLARQETIEKLTPAVESTGMIVAGGVLAATGSTYIADAIVRLLATWMPHWLASLLFGAGLTAGGVVLIRRGSDEFKAISLVPEKTLRSLKEDKAWLVQQIKSRLI